MKNLINSIKSSAKELSSTVTLTVTAMLTALNVILHSVTTIVINNFLQIRFSYLAVASIGFLYGPVVGGLAGALGDIIKYVVRPTGAFFPGFTLNEFIAGFLFGAILYKKPITIKRAFFAKFSVMVTVNLILTPLWLSMMYGKAFMVIMAGRIIKELIMLPIETALLYLCIKAVTKAKPVRVS